MTRVELSDHERGAVMYLGTQFGARDETDLRQLAQLGVEHVDVTPEEHWTEWTVDLLASIRERYAKQGITVESMHSPLSSRDAFHNGMPHVFLERATRDLPATRGSGSWTASAKSSA